MPDKKVATQASDGPWERETIITFNDAEKKASYYTCNKARMEQLKELAKEYLMLLKSRGMKTGV